MKREDLIQLRSVPTLDALMKLAAPYPETDPRALEAFLHILKNAGDLYAALDKHYSRYGLSRGRFVAMLILYHEKSGSLPPAEIAARIGVTPATMTGIVDGLENAGLAQRRKHPSDRRKMLVSLTPLARRRMKKILPDHFQRMAALTSYLSESERRSLMALLGKINSRLADLDPNPKRKT
jgi:DNA-binding MarR family transcriptional regulator